MVDLTLKNLGEMCCCAACITGECLDCERTDFCGQWYGKGRSRQPHNFVKHEDQRNGDHIWDLMDQLSYCFDAISK